MDQAGGSTFGLMAAADGQVFTLPVNVSNSRLSGEYRIPLYSIVLSIELLFSAEHHRRM
jgi:hypothetical protein